MDERLAALNMTSADIDWIVFSHMDFDHTSGLEHLREAKHVMASEKELADSKRYFYRYVQKNWAFAKVETFPFENTGIGPVGQSLDFFGDGSVIFVNTPGHTHGLITTLVRNGEQYAALAGDTFYTAENLKRHIIPGFTVDKRLAQQSLDYMIELSKDQNCVALLANHDPAVWEQTIEL